MKATTFGWAAAAGFVYTFVAWSRNYAHGGPSSEWAIALAVSAVLAIIASILSRLATERSWSAAIANAGASGAITPFVSADSASAIAVSGDGNALLLFTKVGETISSRAIAPSDVLGSEVFEDGDTVISASAGRTLAGAAVGGILFGGAGAIVGGLSGNKKSAQKVSKIELRITLNDMQKPTFDIVFMNTEVARTSAAFKGASQQARDWHGRVSVLIRQADR